MRIVFISGVEFGLRCLEPIVGNGTDIAAIFSLDGREDRSGYVDFSGFGEKHGIPVHKLKEFKELNSSENVKKIKELNPDLVLVIGWSGLIGEDILAIPPKGTLGHHPTMLPKHRGNAPIPWTLINGLSRSGVTLFYLEKEMDTGDIAGQREFEITLDDDASTVYAKAIDATAQLLLDVLPKIEDGSLKPWKQDTSKASKWGKRRPEDGIIDWSKMSIYLHNWIRGLTHPYPGAFSFLRGKKLFIWKAALVCGDGGKAEPGTITGLEGGISVRAGDATILLKRVQLEGEDEMDASEFAKLHELKEGEMLG